MEQRRKPGVRHRSAYLAPVSRSILSTMLTVRSAARAAASLSWAARSAACAARSAAASIRATSASVSPPSAVSVAGAERLVPRQAEVGRRSLTGLQNDLDLVALFGGNVTAELEDAEVGRGFGQKHGAEVDFEVPPHVIQPNFVWLPRPLGQDLLNLGVIRVAVVPDVHLQRADMVDLVLESLYADRIRLADLDDVRPTLCPLPAHITKRSTCVGSQEQ